MVISGSLILQGRSLRVQVCLETQKVLFPQNPHNGLGSIEVARGLRNAEYVLTEPF